MLQYSLSVSFFLASSFCALGQESQAGSAIRACPEEKPRWRCIAELPNEGTGSGDTGMVTGKEVEALMLQLERLDQQEINR